MKLHHRLLLATLAMPMLLVVSLICFWIGSDIVASLKEDAFYSIAESAPRSTVVAAMGQPDVVSACEENLQWDGEPQRGDAASHRCVIEERYEYFLTSYGVRYSADGRVVSTYQYFSE